MTSKFITAMIFPIKLDKNFYKILTIKEENYLMTEVLNLFSKKFLKLLESWEKPIILFSQEINKQDLSIKKFF
jgi:hypothetical protein